MITQTEVKLTFACGNTLTIVTGQISTSEGIHPSTSLSCAKCKGFTVDFNPDDDWRLACKKSELYTLHTEVCGK